MCGRFSQSLSPEALMAMFGAEDRRRETPTPSWNLTPLESVTAVAYGVDHNKRVLMPMTWGILAPWEKHWDTAKLRPSSARSETVATSKMFARAFRQRRCLVPVDAWYEWGRVGTERVPHAFGRRDGTPTVLGGIWESWRGPVGARMLTLAIVTTPANADLAPLHDRMPLVLDQSDWPVWLGEAPGDAGALLRPAAPDTIVAWKVGRDIGNSRINGPELLQAA
jgi:putative SOS response-associated peptidase YedK